MTFETRAFNSTEQERTQRRENCWGRRRRGLWCFTVFLASSSLSSASPPSIWRKICAHHETFRLFLFPKNKSKFCNLLSLLRSNLLLPRDSRLPLAYNSCDVLRTFCLTTTFGGAVLGKNGKLAQSMSFSRHFCSFSFPINFPLLDTQFIKEKNTTMKTTFPLSAFVTRYRFQQVRSRRYPC